MQREALFKRTRSAKRMQAAASNQHLLVWTVLRGVTDERSALAYCGSDEAEARRVVERCKHKMGGSWRVPTYNTGNDDEWWVTNKKFIQLQLHVVKK
jgi:hypothetical protein